MSILTFCTTRGVKFNILHGKWQSNSALYVTWGVKFHIVLDMGVKSNILHRRRIKFYTVHDLGVKFHIMHDKRVEFHLLFGLGSQTRHWAWHESQITHFAWLAESNPTLCMTWESNFTKWTHCAWHGDLSNSRLYCTLYTYMLDNLHRDSTKL